MITIRRAADRGQARHGWLYSQHTFSFADYFNPAQMGFGHLRVINEDVVEAGQGFGTHPHKDMEIISYVVSGELEHKDSMGNGSVIRPGDMQRMSAGTGVTHSEFNPSAQNPAHFLQIWILPNQKGLPPSYEQHHFTQEQKKNKLRLLVSPDGTQGSLKVHQNTRLYGGLLDTNTQVELGGLTAPTKVWVQMVKGAAEVLGQPMGAGDGAAIEGEALVGLKATSPCEVLVFEMW